jgi:hypothetical protein
MREKLKNISLILLVALYFVAANGMVLQYLSDLYSTAGEVAISFHGGHSKDLPVPTLTERTYLPQNFPLVVPSVALLAHTIVYPIERPLFFTWIDEALPSYTTVLTANLSDRAPPTA